MRSAQLLSSKASVEMLTGRSLVPVPVLLLLRPQLPLPLLLLALDGRLLVVMTGKNLYSL
jgi:hypothetical protein